MVSYIDFILLTYIFGVVSKQLASSVAELETPVLLEKKSCSFHSGACRLVDNSRLLLSSPTGRPLSSTRRPAHRPTAIKTCPHSHWPPCPHPSGRHTPGPSGRPTSGHTGRPSPTPTGRPAPDPTTRPARRLTGRPAPKPTANLLQSPLADLLPV